MKNGEQGAFASMNEFERQEGLTKREYFAGLAMQGMLASDYRGDIDVMAVKFADALLAELRKQEYKSKQQEQ
jgi:hypothetical protein